MNVKHSRCMSKIRYILAALAVFAAQMLNAQQRPFDRVVDANPWLYGTNIAGLRADTTSNISYAELSGGAEAGSFRRSYEASSLWHAGAEARTIKHVERFSMMGGFSFSQKEGQDMCGSMFIHPGYYPVDALEFTPGRKTLQTYAFDGGVSVDVADGWRIGAGMDFSSANYSKRKDLRHTNYRLDLTVSSGVTYTSGDFSFGADYIYKKNSESLIPEQIGTGESSYYAFLDKGLYYGKYEVWSGSGVHLDEAGVQGLPLKEHFNGAGVQFAYKNAIFAEAEYLYGSGSAGEKQFIWYRFPSHNFTFRIAENFDYGGSKSYLRESLSWRRQDNFETVNEKITSGGVTTAVEYGQNLIMTRESLDVSVEHRFIAAGGHYSHEFAISSSRKGYCESQMYPFVRDAIMKTYAVSYVPQWRAGNFDLGLGVTLEGGSYDESGRRLDSDASVPGSGVLSASFRLEDYFGLWTGYETCTRLGADPFVRFNFRKGIYIQADAAVLKPFNTEIGKLRYGGSLRLGWDF